jgi:hypothetical protein
VVVSDAHPRPSVSKANRSTTMAQAWAISHTVFQVRLIPFPLAPCANRQAEAHPTSAN